jgi:predicted nucleotide-binding protein
MLAKASFAVLLMTAEDLTGENTLRARQNVVHEAGLFQGHLGFTRAIVIRQESVEEYSNIAGLQYISFSGDAIEQTFPELRRVLHREGMLPPGVS